MREWSLKPGDPLSLTLAADSRLSQVDYGDDQIWELTLGGGDPPAVAVETTYGLRARRLRLFPRFTRGDLSLTDPAEFARPPEVRYFAPNYLRLGFAPFEDIDVESEVWVPESQALAGRLTLRNQGAGPVELRVEWIGQLVPTEGSRLAPTEIEAAPVLCGQTGDLVPVVFLTGGARAESSSYPALVLDLTLEQGEARQLLWTHAGLSDPGASFDLARRTAARRWDAEAARIELANSGLVEIYTGRPDWDAALALSQKQAFSLIAGPTQHLPHPSFILTRLPDQGYSLRGDGYDYNHLWSGQSPLEAYYLAGLLLPAAPYLVAGIVRNFLATQTEDGFIDWKPGLGGQRSRLLATPLLASLAWKVYEYTGDSQFLREAFPRLHSFFQTWFTPEHDRDEDGLPEWDHPMQAGLDDHPLYTSGPESGPWVDIQTVESPALGAFLYNECQHLERIARLLEQPARLPELEETRLSLRAAVESTWDSRAGTYRARDRDTHTSPRGEELGSRQGPGELTPGRRFRQPVRVLVHFQTSGDAPRRPTVRVYGSCESDEPEVEEAPPERCRWYLGQGTLTSECVFRYVDRVEVSDIEPEDQVTVYSLNLRQQDHSLLLPLWAGIPHEKRARSLVEKTITNPEKYWHSYGIPASPYTFGDEPGPTAAGGVHLPWNLLVGEGLLRYGYRDEATALVTRLMDAISLTLKRDAAFRRYYDPAIGYGAGERNALAGLAPLGLFLDVLGVRIISPTRVWLAGFNPFPWPVTVKYRGLTVLRQMEKTTVIFPDGQSIVSHDPQPQWAVLQ